MGTRLHSLATVSLFLAASSLPAQTQEQVIAMAQRRADLRGNWPEWLALRAVSLQDSNASDIAFWHFEQFMRRIPPLDLLDPADSPAKNRGLVLGAATRRVCELLASDAGHEEVVVGLDWLRQCCHIASKWPPATHGRFPSSLDAEDRRRLVATVAARARTRPATKTTQSEAFDLLDWLVDLSDRTTAQQIAQLVLPHLAVDDDQTKRNAWGWAGKLLQVDPNCSLRQPVVDAALQVLATHEPVLGFCRAAPQLLEPRREALASAPEPPSPLKAIVVATASSCSEQVAAALLARTAALPAHATDAFLIDHWTFKARKLDATTARKLHALLSPRFETHDGYWIAVAYALFAAVPDDLVPWYHRWLATPRDRGRCAYLLAELGVELPRDRLRFLVDGDGSGPPAFFDARLPDVTAREWHAGGERRRVAEQYLTLDTITAGVPREVVARATKFRFLCESLPLAKLALLAPHSCEGLEIAIDWAQVGTVVEDLAALRELSTCQGSELFRAIVRRSLRLGEPGHGFLQTMLDSETTTNERIAAIVETLLQATDTPLRVDRAIARLRDTPQANLANAAELRFLGRDPRTAGSLSIVGMSGIDLDANRLQTVLDAMGRPLDSLPQDFERGPWNSPVTLASAWTLAAGLPIERLPIAMAVPTTAHDNAAVRAAAYRILQRLDRTRHPEGWLADEAEFDPDPAVRAIAAK